MVRRVTSGFMAKRVLEPVRRRKSYADPAAKSQSRTEHAKRNRKKKPTTPSFSVKVLISRVSTRPESQCLSGDNASGRGVSLAGDNEKFDHGGGASREHLSEGSSIPVPGVIPVTFYFRTAPSIVASVLMGVASDTSSAALFIFLNARRASKYISGSLTNIPTVPEPLWTRLVIP